MDMLNLKNLFLSLAMEKFITIVVTNVSYCITLKWNTLHVAVFYFILICYLSFEYIFPLAYLYYIVYISY